MGENEESTKNFDFNAKQMTKAQRMEAIAKLEKETGISNGTISRWDTSSPTIENVQKVAEYFGVTVDELLSPAADTKAVETSTE